MIEKLYIGIDPDLRLINAALITDQKQALAVFKRSNKGLSGDKAVAQAVSHAKGLANDILHCKILYKEYLDPACKLVVIVESQNMEHARRMREDPKNKKKINYQNILQLGQMAGIMMGALSSIADMVVLVQPIDWKGTLEKKVLHSRYYRKLGLTPDPEKKVKNIYPDTMDRLSYYSVDKINPGDFWDINDSLGLALYGAKKGL